MFSKKNGLIILLAILIIGAFFTVFFLLTRQKETVKIGTDIPNFKVSLADSKQVLENLKSNYVLHGDTNNLEIFFTTKDISEPSIVQTLNSDEEAIVSKIERKDSGYLLTIKVTPFIKKLSKDEQITWLEGNFWQMAQIIASKNLNTERIVITPIQIFKFS